MKRVTCIMIVILFLFSALALTGNDWNTKYEFRPFIDFLSSGNNPWLIRVISPNVMDELLKVLALVGKVFTINEDFDIAVTFGRKFSQQEGDGTWKISLNPCLNTRKWFVMGVAEFDLSYPNRLYNVVKIAYKIDGKFSLGVETENYLFGKDPDRRFYSLGPCAGFRVNDTATISWSYLLKYETGPDEWFGVVKAMLNLRFK